MCALGSVRFCRVMVTPGCVNLISFSWPHLIYRIEIQSILIDCDHCSEAVHVAVVARQRARCPPRRRTRKGWVRSGKWTVNENENVNVGHVFRIILKGLAANQRRIVAGAWHRELQQHRYSQPAKAAHNRWETISVGRRTWRLAQRSQVIVV